MANIYNCDPSDLVEKAGEELKKIEIIKPTEWAAFVKTGMHKERPPLNNDWWFIRTASILRKVYVSGPIGVSKLRTKYGGKKNRGVKTEHFYKGSGSIIRKIMQQLENEGFVKKDLKSLHKGRVITAKGKKFLDDVAGKISKVTVEKVPKTEIKKDAKEETKKEIKEKEVKENKEVKSEKKVKQKETKTEKKETPKK